MNPAETRLRFFLGANTPQGFVSRFDQLTEDVPGWRTYIIKGGPGCGKSTMMRRIADACTEAGEPIELIHCSSDADSLDGVIVPGKRFSICDGTSPHVLEPKYPGAVESLVNIGACWDAEQLHACAGEIKTLSASCSSCHEYCCRFLSAAGSLMSDTYRIALECVDQKKLTGYLGRLRDKELRPRKVHAPKERVRFLSAVTNQGVVKFTDSAKQLAERIYLINDDHGAVSRLMLNYLRSAALEAGYEVISCYCPLAPFDKLEQLFVPQLSLGFMTSNRFHNFDLEFEPYRIVNSQRFTEADGLKGRKKRINFNRKAAGGMLTQAEELLREAKQLHDELESYYINATDFDKVETLTQSVLDQVAAM